MDPYRVRITTTGVPLFWPHFDRIGTALMAKICPDCVTPLGGIIRGPGFAHRTLFGSVICFNAGLPRSIDLIDWGVGKPAWEQITKQGHKPKPPIVMKLADQKLKIDHMVYHISYIILSNYHYDPWLATVVDKIKFAPHEFAWTPMRDDYKRRPETISLATVISTQCWAVRRNIFRFPCFELALSSHNV